MRIKKALIIVSSIIICVGVFSAAALVVIIPKNMTNQIETALENNDGVQIKLLYEKMCSYPMVIPEAQNAFDKRADEIAQDFNKHFVNYETQEEMDNYLKSEYGNVFFKNENDMEIDKDCGPFGELYILRDSKIECSLYKAKFDKELEEWNAELSDIEKRKERSIYAENELKYLKAEIDISETDFEIFNPMNDDVTLKKFYEYRQKKISLLKNRIEKLEVEFKEN